MEDRRQEILDAAVDLADELGLEAVSMRALAERTGVTPMALYSHVGSKAELLDGMVGRLLAQLRLPESAGAAMPGGPGPAPDAPGPDWRERLRTLGHSARTLVHRHPWASALLFSRPAVAPDAVRVVDQINAMLRDAGVPSPEVPRLERLVGTVILGFAASEAGGRFGAAEPGCPVDWDAEFEADLDDVLRLVEMTASGKATTSTPGSR
jgi:AcrR family transcriptional regulator